MQVTVSLMSSAAIPLKGTLRVGVIDGWKVDPSAPAAFEVGARGRAQLAFSVTPSEKVYNAYYPIHAFAEFEYEGARLTAHPILILNAHVPNPPRVQLPIAWEPVAVPANAAMNLAHLPVRREWLVAGEPLMLRTGSVADSFELQAPVQYEQRIERGGTRHGLTMLLGPRPSSFVDNVQMVVTEYPLSLPQTKPVRLRFAVAAGDGLPNQPVSFRLRVLPFEAPSRELGETLFERRMAAGSWQDVEVNLDSYAGKKARVQLESAGDFSASRLAHWAGPVLLAGSVMMPQSEEAPGGTSHLVGTLDAKGERYEARIWPGRRGILDAQVGLVSGSRKLSFHGFQVRVLGDDLAEWDSTNSLVAVHEESANGRYRLRHHFSGWAGSFDLMSEAWAEKGALRIRFWLDKAPQPRPWLDVHLEEVALGPWSEHAKRIYAGQGNVIEEPEAFHLDADGQYLSTSYIGLDFANGVSLVQAVDGSPDELDVQPKSRLYTFRTPNNQVLTLIPSADVWQAAQTWGALNEVQASAGVAKAAGRFTFDLWGRYGSYRDGTAQLARAFRYGLTDSFVVWHNWQRWGYDYRLPDIFPPNPRGGSLEDFKNLAQLCRDHGVLFAPHDNYIDSYPDAEGFTYDAISFEAHGTPQKAWFNTATQAQSYRFRPDRVVPFVERNLRLIRDGFAPTGYFIDVWSSLSPHDFWDSDGRYHPRSETTKIWGDAFAWIRDYLGNNAPQISEAGHDQLIGKLDGAQSQMLRVDSSTKRGYFLHIRAADSERIPWMDAVYHDRFVMQGAGYPERYFDGVDGRTHSAYSDDYMSSEVLTGHAPMVPAIFNRDVVRKYWLLHDVMRALSLRRFESHEFVGGNLHRQKVRWANGAEVYVNRGSEDWTVAGHVLPQYGFYARAPFEGGVAEAAVERRDGAVVEWSSSPSMYYLNSRAEMGGFRATRDGSNMQLTLLPDSGPVQLRFQWGQLPWKLPLARQAQVLDEDGKVLRDAQIAVKDGWVSFTSDPGVFGYRLTL